MSERAPKSIGERFKGFATKINHSRFAPYLKGAGHLLELSGTAPHIDDDAHSTRKDADAIRSAWENAIDEYEKLLEEKSPLEMTAEEMKAVGTPPETLITNPEKTWAETMTDEEVAVYLRKNMDSIKRLSERAAADPFAERSLPTFERNLSLSVDYLSRVGRLPEEFRTDTEENEI